MSRDVTNEVKYPRVSSSPLESSHSNFDDHSIFKLQICMFSLKSAFFFSNKIFLHKRAPPKLHRAMSLTTRSMARIDIPAEMKIELTNVEEEICVLLDDCTKHLAEKGIVTSCRIAGGWVRDKVNNRGLSVSLSVLNEKPTHTCHLYSCLALRVTTLILL